MSNELPLVKLSRGSTANPPTQATGAMQDGVERNIPRDKHRIIFWIMIIQGMSGLLPFNMFINAYGYFGYKFNGTDVSFSDSFESYFSIVYMIPVLLTTGFAVWLQTRVSIKTRYYVGTVIMLVLFTITTAFVKVPTKHWVKGFFPLTLITLFALGTFGSINQSSVFGLGGVLGESYVGAVMFGQSIAGILSSVATIITVSISPITTGQCQPGNLETAALGYFSLAIIVLIISLVSFSIIIRMDFTKYFIQIGSTTSQNRIAILGSDESTKLLPKIGKKNTPNYAWKEILTVFLEIWPFTVAVFIVFLVTLSLYPTVVSSIVSTSYHGDHPEQHPWSDCLFAPLMCFLLFNVGDCVGRTLPQWVVWPRNRYAIMILVTCRVVFYPLILLCNHKGTHTSAIVFKSDIFPILFNSLLGVTNGYFGTICMILAPQAVDSKRVETASIIMVFFFAGGLTGGAFLSFAMLPIMGVKLVA